MNKNLFLGSAAKWHGIPEPEGMRTTTRVSVLRGGQQHFLKEVQKVFDNDGNESLSIKVTSTACGHVVDEPTKVIVIDDKLYCTDCVKRCPSCGQDIEPGTGEQVEQTWYHRPCAEPHRKHAEFKRLSEEAFLEAKAQAARAQAMLGAVQVEAAVTNTERVRHQIAHEQRRMDLDEAREARQAALAAVQVTAAYENIDIANRRLELDERTANRADATTASQLESDALRRRIEDGRFRLEVMERASRLQGQPERGQLP